MARTVTLWRFKRPYSDDLRYQPKAEDLYVLMRAAGATADGSGFTIAGLAAIADRPQLEVAHLIRTLECLGLVERLETDLLA